MFVHAQVFANANSRLMEGAHILSGLQAWLKRPLSNAALEDFIDAATA